MNNVRGNFCVECAVLRRCFHVTTNIGGQAPQLEDLCGFDYFQQTACNRGAASSGVTGGKLGRLFVGRPGRGCAAK
ncbi:hypothetical protein NDU88_004588 [Pleurodeles waltl]|uniref:Uncharacterized protein n=1 Tax=Pleurodeles waltl TaxID=8319 RepID=A0AAV7PDI7_PLEWA|nr:hypothetical protein NDU88_004588 [Pleurodeles waltl]